MTSINQKLLKTYGLSGLAFVVTGILISWLFTVPHMTVVIDRSYCPSHQWRSVAAHYEQLYQQHQRHQIQINSVVLFSDLDQEERSHPPNPSEIAALSTYGKKNLARQQQVQRGHLNTRLLEC
jgi:hypothetical protein